MYQKGGLKSRIVIFGCGYVGGELAHSCLERGWQVTALTRNKNKADSLLKSGVDTVVADLHGTDWHKKISTEQDYLVNCVGAAEPSINGYINSYRMGMKSILKWTEQANSSFDTLLFTSSTSVYPQTDGSFVSEESNHMGISERGKVLLDAEDLCRKASVARFKRRFVLRFAGLYGPGRHLLINQIMAGKKIRGSGKRILNLLHQKDAVDAILACLDSDNPEISGTYNVADDRHASRAEIVEWVAKRLDLKNPGFVEIEQPGHPDRRVVSENIREIFNWKPKFPGFEVGYEDLLATL